MPALKHTKAVVAARFDQTSELAPEPMIEQATTGADAPTRRPSEPPNSAPPVAADAEPADFTARLLQAKKRVREQRSDEQERQ